MYIYIYIYIYMLIHVYINIFLYTHIYIFIYIYIYEGVYGAKLVPFLKEVKPALVEAALKAGGNLDWKNPEWDQWIVEAVGEGTQRCHTQRGLK